MANQWRSAGDMPAEGNLVLVRLRPDEGGWHIWPECNPMLVAAYVRDGFYCYANNGAKIQGTLIICGWVPMAEALAALGERPEAGSVPNMPNIPPLPPRKIGTGAEALARERAAEDPEEPCRVRRVIDGKYLEWDDTGATFSVYSFITASVYPRHRAAAIANALIVITGDHGIEIEPVNG